MSKYSEIEIQTAENLMTKGYKWIAKDKCGSLHAYRCKPYKYESVWYEASCSKLIMCESVIPIFLSIKWEDKDPTSLEEIISPPILDSTEKRYLECVLRPLPKVTSIVKVLDTPPQKERLRIRFVDGSYMYFPYFEKVAMYQGMTLGRNYTPEELRLNLEGKHETD